jgi:hypothetical protein
MNKKVLWFVIVFFVFSGIFLPGEEKPAAPGVTVDEAVQEGSNQLIVWSSGDREVALKMVFMYAYNCQKRKWMDKVRLLVWGASTKLLSVDQELQEEIKKLKETGVELWACKGCADLYGVTQKLESLGIDVHYTGKDLADMQKQGWYVLTF